MNAMILTLLPDIQQRGVDPDPGGGVSQLTKKTRAQSHVKTPSTIRVKRAECCAM